MIKWCPSHCHPHGSVAEGVSHDAEPIQVFAVFVEFTGHLHGRLVLVHHIQRFLETFFAQALAQKRKGMVALAIVHLKQRRAVAQERRMDIAPLAPLRRVNRKESFTVRDLRKLPPLR